MSPLSPAHDEVHVWVVALEQPACRAAELVGMLSADESARAARLRWSDRRRRFEMGRGLLRETLARYTGGAPGALRFRYNAHGKPALDAQSATGGLRFNLSHADDLALIAVARGQEIGIDVEKVRPSDDHERIAAWLFTPEQQAHLLQAQPDRRLETFFRCWTWMEATAKARGTGIGVPQEVVPHWFSCELDPAPDYVATLALEEHPCRVTMIDASRATCSPTSTLADASSSRKGPRLPS